MSQRQGSVLQQVRLRIRRCKRLAEFMFFRVFDVWVLRNHARVTHSVRPVAMVFVELLGDFHVWLPYGRRALDTLAPEQPICLIVNQACADLAAWNFPNVQVLAVDFRPFLGDLAYRAAILRRLRGLGATQAYHWACPRVAYAFADSIVAALGCPATGMAGEFIDRSLMDRWWSRRLYEQLLPSQPGRHQGEYYAQMLQALGLEPPLDAAHRSAPWSAGELRLPPSGYFIIAPGSSSPHRCWPIERFVSVARHVLQRHSGWHCVVLGTGAEQHLGRRVQEELGARCQSLCGQTNTRHLAALIAGSRLVLCNDSAASHIAAYYQVPCIAVVGGGNFGLSLPYSRASGMVVEAPVCVSTHMACFGCSWICRFPDPGAQPFPCIREIAVEAVTRAIDEVIDPVAPAPGAAVRPSRPPHSEP